MAKVIKRGKCDFVSIDCNVNTHESSSKIDRPNSEGFNKLLELFPKKENEESFKGSSNKASVDVDSLNKKEQAEEIIKNAKIEAQLILESAEEEARLLKQEAKTIIKEAKKNAEEIESTAYTLGYEQGQKDGEEIGRKQFEIGLQHLESFLKEFKKQTKELANYYEAQMVQVVLVVAKKILEKEVEEDKELISRILKSALNKAIEGSSIVVYMNPRDFENLNKEFVDALSSPGGNKIKIKIDNTIKRGGCMIETEFGLIDANLESRWLGIVEEIEKDLREKTGFSLNKNLKSLTDESI